MREGKIEDSLCIYFNLVVNARLSNLKKGKKLAVKSTGRNGNLVLVSNV